MSESKCSSSINLEEKYHGNKKIRKVTKAKRAKTAYKNNDFKNSIFHYFAYYSLIVKKTFHVRINARFKRYFARFYNQIENKFHVCNIYQKLPKKIRSPNLISASIIYTIMAVYYDIDDIKITKEEFCNHLLLHDFQFTRCLNYCLEHFFILKRTDETNYFKKVIQYHEHIVEKIDDQYTLNFTNGTKQALRQRIVELYNYFKNSPIYVPIDIQEKFRNMDRKTYEVLKNGYQISHIFKNKMYNLFLPQYLAVVLTHFCRETSEIAKKVHLNLHTLCYLMGYSIGRIKRIDKLLRFSVERKEGKPSYHSRYFPKENFEQYLKKLYQKTRKIDYLLVIELYKISGLSPEEFAKNIISYTSKKRGTFVMPRTLITMLESRNSIGHKTYQRMINNFTKLYTQKRISRVNLDKAISIIKKAEHLKIASLKHGNVRFEFLINKKNLKDIQDARIRNKLSTYIHNILKEQYPKDLFNDPTIARSSLLHLNGSNNEKIKENRISDFIQQLDEKGLMHKQENGFLFSFKDAVQKTCNRYAKLGLIPHHPEILRDLINKQKHAICVEFPVWMQTKDGEYMTGHIDVLGYHENTIIIGEYKPTEKQIFRSLPQIASYAYMIKQRLNLNDFNNVLCVGFSKEAVWTFKPQLLENVLEFVKKENITRTNKLKCILSRKGLVPRDIEQELIKILA